MASRRNPFRPKPLVLFGWLALALYTAYAASLLDFSLDRFLFGLGNGARFLGRMFPPELGRWNILLEDLAESMQIAVLASAFGVALSLPVGFLAARNLMPPLVTWPARGVIALCRSFHPVIVAILFVKAVGFGALAGILALIVFSVGFIAKLFAEAIEEISLKQVEAVRATGAGFPAVVLFGVMPQVTSRFLNFSTYQVEVNLRNSTMVGIVGAGGIGGTLFAAFQRFDYDFVATILISIIVLIMVGEALTDRVRAVFK
ncbi:phosphonate ABC transporter, inner membrane subunit [Alkalidesulfovibrio alkalitolerans DSM 16529]|jgi:phosphonate transport system permease protein|uniref:Phosphonate ABC transporter, inner membrane subunit n=1 Tax=Alkalidesulfovibrio alkalitolerans DSM 16529 TaxID=1121439 RepID=S7UEY8_9BACT|nr:phosphonate ABC transporter, permease protein PhnE [Alkalidesulfovibrio alkalitolerans]EPR32384.1 phosphonate ABC transporter, inner membrane subunit [Alkalidesulfovibrio alkalitolerans DSM 16529]